MVHNSSETLKNIFYPRIELEDNHDCLVVVVVAVGCSTVVSSVVIVSIPRARAPVEMATLSLINIGFCVLKKSRKYYYLEIGNGADRRVRRIFAGNDRVRVE